MSAVDEKCTCRSLPKLEGALVSPRMRARFRCRHCIGLDASAQGGGSEVGELDESLLRLFRGAVVKGRKYPDR